MPHLQFPVERTESCILESFLRHDCGLSRRQICRLKHIPDGLLCNGRPIRTIDTVHHGDVISLHIQDSQTIAPNAALQVPLVFEDEDMLVFDKPAGMPVHPSQNHHMDTLGNAFAARYPDLTFRPVNRLDCNTSGLVAVARHPMAASRLHDQIAKTYLALISGEPPESGTIDAPIGRAEGSVILRCVSADGKHAVTHYRILQHGAYHLAEVHLETGRTHQIRVHFAHMGCPLAGDDLYGGSCRHIRRQALHCAQFLYTDSQGMTHRIVSDLPADMQNLLNLPIFGDFARESCGKSD